VDEAKDVQLVHAIRLQKTSPFIDSSYKISMGFEKKKKKHFASNIYLYYLYLEGS